jgi:FtsP/CotA-like multicopper oxidase with cupredoxin domain
MSFTTVVFVLALGAVAINAATATELLTPVVLESLAGVLNDVLVIDEYTARFTTPKVMTFKTRGYFTQNALGGSSNASRALNDGLQIGPTYAVKAGDVLNVTLVNDLEVNADQAGYAMNTVHTPGTTNVHTHGLHVSSYEPHDNVMIKIEPGMRYQYSFEIIDDHAGGTHWYHSHVHGSTAIQTGGGTVGVIVVKDAADEVPSDLQAITDKVLMVQYTEFDEVVKIAQATGSGSTAEAWTSTSTGIGAQEAFFTVNGQYQPTLTINQNEWMRLRLVFMALTKVVEFKMSSGAAGLGCEWGLLAKDGVYVKNAPRALSSVYMAPGNRADVVVRCSSVGTFTIDTVGGAQTHIATTANVWTISVASSTTVAAALTTFTAKRPNYLADTYNYAGTGIKETHTLLFAASPQACLVKFDNQGELYDEISMGSMAAGSIQEWDISGVDKHPFHIHVNPFQIGTVTDSTGDSNPYFVIGDWHDVLFRPAGVAISKAYFHVADFAGTVVIHCHFLHHEDKGCMGFLEITGANGTVAADLLASALIQSSTSPPPPPPPPPSSGTTTAPRVVVAVALLVCVLAVAV